MATGRLSIFDDDEVDLTAFQPKQGSGTGPDPQQVRAVSEASHFPSRQVQPPAAAAQLKRTTHHRTTGRTAQLAVKVRPAFRDRMYAIAERNNWLVGETIERALDALEREMGEGTHGS